MPELMENVKTLIDHRVQVIDPDDDYAGLIGTVVAVHLANTPEHDTDNPDDDVIVDLDPEQANLLRDHYTSLVINYDNPIEVNLEQVIFAPAQLRLIDE